MNLSDRSISLADKLDALDEVTPATRARWDRNAALFALAPVIEAMVASLTEALADPA